MALVAAGVPQDPEQTWAPAEQDHNQHSRPVHLHLLAPHQGMLGTNTA